MHRPTKESVSWFDSIYQRFRYDRRRYEGAGPLLICEGPKCCRFMDSLGRADGASQSAASKRAAIAEAQRGRKKRLEEYRRGWGGGGSVGEARAQPLRRSEGMLPRVARSRFGGERDSCNMRRMTTRPGGAKVCASSAPPGRARSARLAGRGIVHLRPGAGLVGAILGRFRTSVPGALVVSGASTPCKRRRRRRS